MKANIYLSNYEGWVGVTTDIEEEVFVLSFCYNYSTITELLVLKVLSCNKHFPKQLFLDLWINLTNMKTVGEKNS